MALRVGDGPVVADHPDFAQHRSIFGAMRHVESPDDVFPETRFPVVAPFGELVVGGMPDQREAFFFAHAKAVADIVDTP